MHPSDFCYCAELPALVTLDHVPPGWLPNLLTLDGSPLPLRHSGRTGGTALVAVRSGGTPVVRCWRCRLFWRIELADPSGDVPSVRLRRLSGEEYARCHRVWKRMGPRREDLELDE